VHYEYLHQHSVRLQQLDIDHYVTRICNQQDFNKRKEHPSAAQEQRPPLALLVLSFSLSRGTTLRGHRIENIHQHAQCAIIPVSLDMGCGRKVFGAEWLLEWGVNGRWKDWMLGRGKGVVVGGVNWMLGGSGEGVGRGGRTGCWEGVGRGWGEAGGLDVGKEWGGE
jgi:hypothetical protein